MNSVTISELEEILKKAAAPLPKITAKKMFGCYALWANENVFALVWKHGQIGVKLPDEKSYEALLTVSGARPWKVGPMQMAHWILLPKTFHEKPTEVKKWVTKAHALCSVLEKKVKKSPKKKGKQ